MPAATDLTSLLRTRSFPGSAWERTAAEPPPRLFRTPGPLAGRRIRGIADEPACSSKYSNLLQLFQLHSFTEKATIWSIQDHRDNERVGSTHDSPHAHDR